MDEAWELTLKGMRRATERVPKWLRASAARWVQEHNHTDVLIQDAVIDVYEATKKWLDSDRTYALATYQYNAVYWWCTHQRRDRRTEVEAATEYMRQRNYANRYSNRSTSIDPEYLLSLMTQTQRHAFTTTDRSERRKLRFHRESGRKMVQHVQDS